jgi:hypothetical protein
MQQAETSCNLGCGNFATIGDKGFETVWYSLWDIALTLFTQQVFGWRRLHTNPGNKRLLPAMCGRVQIPLQIQMLLPSLFCGQKDTAGELLCTSPQLSLAPSLILLFAKHSQQSCSLEA